MSVKKTHNINVLLLIYLPIFSAPRSRGRTIYPYYRPYVKREELAITCASFAFIVLPTAWGVALGETMVV